MLKGLFAAAGLACLSACQLLRPPAPAADAVPSASSQWLYGSAESAASFLTHWDQIAAHVEAAALRRPATSVVLAAGANADAPRFEACGTKPLAAVFDADETVIWNLGAQGYFAERGLIYDVPAWLNWEKTGAGKAVATPGAVDAFARLRAAGVTPILNTNRTSSNAQGTIATLAAAGLGNFEHGRTLFLRGDAGGGSGKDGRRAEIARTYCVVALAGDQLGDIADLFNADGLAPPERKALATAPAFAPLWGKGWFMLPNPVYGPSIKGDFDEVFPPATRWSPGEK